MRVDRTAHRAKEVGSMPDPTDDEDPIRGITAHLILADAAQPGAEGRVSMLGAGWTVTGPAPTPFAVVVMMEVPQHETGREHQVRLEVIDMDGTPFTVPTPKGFQPLVLEANLPVPSANDLPWGFPVSVVVVLNSGPVPFPPDSCFEWRLMIDGKTNADWRRAFRTRPMIQSNSASDNAEAA
jgi:hypothetical protein